MGNSSHYLKKINELKKVIESMKIRHLEELRYVSDKHTSLTAIQIQLPIIEIDPFFSSLRNLFYSVLKYFQKTPPKETILLFGGSYSKEKILDTLNIIIRIFIIIILAFHLFHIFLKIIEKNARNNRTK